MLKREIVVLIAGGLLSTQVALARAEGVFPSSNNESYQTPTPATVKYLEQRAASDPNPTGASAPVFPVSAASVGGSLTPALAKYLAERPKDVTPVRRTVRIDTSTPHINVEHLQTVKIENDKGQSFVWQADTLAAGEDNFSLQAIAPTGFAAGRTQVFLSHPHEHMLHN